jgi:hypothetical protein
MSATFPDLKAKMYNYTKKSHLALGNLAKLVFWSILSFKYSKVISEVIDLHNGSINLIFKIAP